MELKEIGLRIKFLRQSQGLTQKELAEKIGTTWEMVSRYETGKSSPLSRIDQIAESLNTSIDKLLQESVVEDSGQPYRGNAIPLIDKPFADITVAIKETKDYYIAPDWITKKFISPFAIDSEILEVNTTQLEKNGIFFATMEKIKGNKNIVLSVDKNKQLSVQMLENTSASEKVIATIVAWEKRFV